MTKELSCRTQRRLGSWVEIRYTQISPSFSEEVGVKGELWKPNALQGRRAYRRDGWGWQQYLTVYVKPFPP